jgi:formamidopyrimidine-DNA glycosylase
VPELPDLVHVARRLGEALAGRRVTGARTGDPTVLRVMVPDPFPACLVGRVLESVERRGHFVLFALEGGLRLVVNCMLVGRFELGAPAAPGRDKTSLGLALSFDGPPAELRYVDERRMGKVYVAPEETIAAIPVFGALGVDVLSRDFTRDRFRAIVKKRRDQVRRLLMDKTALASIGNAYADEILFAARIHPKTFCGRLAPAEVDALHAAIGDVLRAAIDEIARRDEPVDVKVRDFLAVRGRVGQPCRRCGTKIRSVREGDGDACFCPTCQPATRALFVDWSKLPKREG